MTPLRFAPAAFVFAAAVMHADSRNAVVPTPLIAESPLADAFDFESAESEAMALAGKPYVPAKDVTPDFFRNLPHEQAREIRFNPGKAEWAGKNTPFRAQFIHPGPFRPAIADFFTSEGSTPKPVPYSKERFDFGKLRIPAGTPDPSGYAGFRWHGEILAKGVWDDFATFLGATYFRCLPSQPDVSYGISARGVAVNTAMSEIPEDFPVFRKFWLERPAKGSATAVVYALMDSPHITGAYRFEITPGKVLAVKVRTRLFFRDKVERLGVAPFSTMFRFGENSTPRPADFRPEVHDCDGLLFETEKGARYWRPLLSDAGELRHSVFTVGKPKGFGLRQRDLDFGSYEDLDENYHRKPGVWVTPGSEWPEGTLQLIEMPDGDATWDNVVAYWAPATIPAPGESLLLEYTIRWALDPDFGDPSGHVVSTRVGEVKGQPGVTRYVVDFSDTGKNPKDAPKLKLEPYGDTEVVASRIAFNPDVRGWRAFIDIRAKRAVPPTPVIVAKSGTPVKTDGPAQPAAAGEEMMMAAGATKPDAKTAPVAASQSPAKAPSKPGPPEPLRPGIRAWLERNGRAVSERWDYRGPAVK